MLIKLVSQLPGGTLRGWDIEQRNFVGRVKSQESSKGPPRRAGTSETARAEGRRKGLGERWEEGLDAESRRTGLRFPQFEVQ